MPEISLSYPPPKNEDDFDQMCCSLFRRLWVIPDLTRHGRRGQRQNGVDFYGQNERGLWHGGQSKLRSGADGLTKQEALDEIKAAKTFEPALKHFAIITSSKRDVSLQKLERLVNLEHREKGLFTFKIYFWDDLVELLHDHQDIRDKYFGGASASQLEEIKALVSKQLLISEEGRNVGGMHAEIDEAANYLKHGNWSLARVLLERMRERKWHSFEAVEKYRVLANLGHTYEQEGKYEQAAKYFLQAASELPDDERSMVRKVCAHSYLSDDEAARVEANKLRTRFPESSDAYALWIRTSPQNKSFEELERSIPPHLRNEANVAYELSRKAIAVRQFDEAERYARIGISEEADDPLVSAQLGVSILAKQINLNAFLGRYAATSCGNELLEEAVRNFSFAIDSSKNGANIGVRCDLLLKRAIAYELLGNRSARHADIALAYSLEPTNTECLINYALLLEDTNCEADAIELLEDARSNTPQVKPLLLLAELLAARNLPNDREEALTILKQIMSIDSLESKEIGHLAEFFVRLAIATGKQDEIDAFLNESAKEHISQTYFQVLLGKVHLAANRREAAKKCAFDAKAAISTETPPSDQLLLGRFFHSLEEHQHVVDVLRNVLSPRVLSDDTIRMLESAHKCDEVEFAINFCAELRAAGIYDVRCVDLEIGLLHESQCLEKAIRIIQDIVPNVDAEFRRELNVRRSILGIEIGRLELVETHPDQLPLVEMVNPPLGRMTVLLLRRGKEPLKAVEYAYKLVRLHFNEPEARMAMVVSLGLALGDDERIAFPACETVLPGTAVGYRETGSDVVEWRIIEDLPEPNREYGELSPDHPLSQELLGKSVGQEFVFRRNAVQSRTATIAEIIPKYVYRFRECLESWEERYPDQFFVQQLRIEHTPAGDPDLTPIFKSIDQRILHTQSLDTLYRDNPVSLYAAASAFGESIIGTMQHIINQPNLPIRCTLFSDDDLSNIHKLPSAQRIVIEPTALATLFLTDSFDQLILQNGPWIITEGSRREIAQWREKVREKNSEGGYLTKIDGRHVLIPNGTIDRSRIEERFSRFEALIDERVIIEPGDEILNCGKELRQELLSFFGPVCTQSIALAMRPGFLLWSDDLVVATIAAHSAECGVVWTQGVSAWLSETGQITSESHVDLSLKLLEMNYSYTLISPSLVLHAAEKTRWNPDDPTLQKCVQWFSNRETRPERMFQLFVTTLRKLWCAVAIHQTAEHVTFRILDQITTRPDGRKMIRELHRKAIMLFGLNVVAAEALREVIEAWDGAGGGQNHLLLPSS